MGNLAMNIKDLETLVSNIRQYLQVARTQDDAFEYCRLCDELSLAEAALSEVDYTHRHQSAWPLAALKGAVAL